MYLPVKTEKIAKLFFLTSCAGLFFYAVLAFYTFHSTYSSLTKLMKIQHNFIHKSYSNKVIPDDSKDDLLYILLWTISNNTDIEINNKELFEDHQCSYSNCYATTNKNLLNGDYTRFDAIVYNISFITNWNRDLAKNRSSHQKFVFHSIQSSDDFPVCNVFADNYFNLTWTYKLDSDIVSPYFKVRDLQGNVVAPSDDVKWESAMQNITEHEIKHLRDKRKAMIWIVDKCDTRNARLEFAKQLQSLFKKNFLDFDIFGCDMFECADDICYKNIERDYYFYFVAEDSNAVDYVTAEVLKAYKNYAVPLVYGGANYTKFLPEGSYINVDSTSIDGVVALIEYIIKNPYVYYNFHRWRKIYMITEKKPFKGICELCTKLNNWRGTKIKKSFRNWWFSKPLFNRCFPGGADSYSEVLSYVNSSRHRL